MTDKMTRFLAKIEIDNVESFDIDFEMINRNRFDREKWDMVIVKRTPWKYELLNQFMEALHKLDFKYSLIFSYMSRPSAEDAIQLLFDWYQSIYRLPLSLDIKSDDNGYLTVQYESETEKTQFSPAIKDFRDFLNFINYEFVIREEVKEPVVETNSPVIEETRTVEDEKPAVKEPIKTTAPSSKPSDDKTDEAKNDLSIEEQIVQEQKEMTESVENELLKIMKANAQQMARERERARINKRGNYEPIDFIDEITTNSNNVDFSATVFSIEVNTFNNKSRVNLGVNDAHGGAIYVGFAQNATLNEELIGNLKNGVNVRIRGAAYLDEFSKQLTVRAHFIDLLPPDEIEPEPEEKHRVELHLHSNFSAMDAVTKMGAYAKYAKALGHTAMAVTDHAVVQAYPDAQAAEKATGVKMLYGVEFYMVDDKLNYIKNPSNIPLEKAKYVVLDLETTGLSARYDRIIEFGAVRVEKGMVVENLDLLINPERKLPEKIVEITNITDAMLRYQPTIKEAMPQILEFLQDAIIVTHNAEFDFSFLQEELANLGLPLLTNPVIDTLSLSQFLYPEDRNHRLGTLCRKFEVVYDEDSAHRADYDAQVLNDCWMPMLVKLMREQNIVTHEDLGKLPNSNTLLKHMRANHCIALAKNKAGLKDLYKLVSLSHVDFLADVPKLPKSELVKLRENLIVGSACFNSDVFRTARYYNEERLKQVVSFYDYIEIQPIENYSYMINMGDATEEEILKYVKDIVKVADDCHIPVCATGDVHYLTPKEKVFRDVYIYSKGLGNTNHPLNPYARSKVPHFENPDQHYRTTREMLDAMAFLGEEKAYEVTVTNTNAIADQIESLRPVPNDKLYTPTIENCDNMLRDMCFEKAHELYGEQLPEFIENRLELELNGIINNGYAVIYYIAHRLVKQANDDGYIVGSRGSVGSSFVATMSGITEVNPLPPHYRCPSCKHFEWTKETYPGIKSGYDLPEKTCPHCGAKMIHDGQDIPFQTFLGFNADKTPDIDLNFPGDYQARAHNYTKVLLGENNVFRAGTIETVADKTAFGYARGYLERNGIDVNTYPKAKIAYIASGCVDVKRTTGQHPGGIVVVPTNNEVYDFTPIQFPADDLDAEWKTTHFDFHSIHDTILKLDLLGHVDPMALKMMCDLTGIPLKQIPLNDPKVISIFSSPDALGMKNDYTGAETGALAIPEFGTEFVRGMLTDTRPKSFSDLVILSGLSHGTGVWNGNADELIKNGTATLQEVIGCRDDIMTYLISMGLPPKVSFTIMEDVRKGRGLKPEYIEIMKQNKVPDFYIESCQKIQYMFPKGHAVAYVTMAIRVGYFKVYYPLEFYATFFTCRSKQYDIATMIKGREAIISRLEELKYKSRLKGAEKISPKEAEQLKTLNICLEMVQRGYKFSNIDLYRSDASAFVVDHENKSLIPPFITIDGLGEKAALTVLEQRKLGKFSSKQDLLRRTGLSSTNVEDLSKLGVLDDLNENDQLSLFDF